MRTSFLSLFAVSLLLISSAGLAQPASTEATAKKNNRVLEVVFVTAQKREQNLLDVPMSVTALSQDFLEDIGAQNLQDISRVTPGLSLTETAPGVQNIQIRGISATGVKATVGYQIDNISMTSFVSTQPDAPTFDLRSVEVLRGPQGTLYGEGSMGGTIKLITNPPKPDIWEAGLQGSSFATKDGDKSWTGDAFINIPLGGFSALRLVGSEKDIGGWIDQVDRQESGANWAKKRNYRARYALDLFESIGFDLTWMRNDLAAGSSNAADDNYQRFDIEETGVEDRSDLYAFDVDWDFGWASLQFSKTLFDRDILFKYDGTQFFGNGPVPDTNSPLDIITNIAVGEAVRSNPGDIDVSTRIEGTELRLSGLTGPVNWVVGAYKADKLERFGLLNDIVLNDIVPEGDTADRQPYQEFDAVGDSDQSAIFAQVDWDILEWLTLTVGARKFEENVTLETKGTTAQILDISNYDEGDFDAFTPRVALSMRDLNFLPSIFEQTSMYISAAKGFRSGGANIRNSDELETGGTTQPIPGTYEPDILTSYEIGMKTVMFGGKLMAEFSVFRNEWENIQSTAQQTEGATRFNYVANVGETEGNGFEWGFLWLPIEGLTLNFSGGVIDTEFVIDDISKYNGDPVDHVAPRTAAIGAAYNFHVYGPYRGFVRWDTSYSDRTEYTNRAPVFAYESDITRFSNFKIGVEHDRFKIYGFVRNVFDYRANVDANQPLLQAKSRPRTIGVEFKVGV